MKEFHVTVHERAWKIVFTRFVVHKNYNARSSLEDYFSRYSPQVVQSTVIHKLLYMLQSTVTVVHVTVHKYCIIRNSLTKRLTLHFTVHTYYYSRYSVHFTTNLYALYYTKQPESKIYFTRCSPKEVYYTKQSERFTKKSHRNIRNCLKLCFYTNM